MTSRQLCCIIIRYYSTMNHTILFFFRAVNMIPFIPCMALEKPLYEAHREYPKDCVNLRTNVRLTYEYGGFLWPDENQIHRKRLLFEK